MSEQLVAASAVQSDTSLVEAISKIAPDGARLEAIATSLNKTLDESLLIIERLVGQGLLSYNLTTGFTLTEQADKLIAEEGTFSHHSVGSRMPAPISSPNMTAISAKRAEKLRHLARERERTRDRLRQLAQEGTFARRPLKTLRD